MNPLPRARLLPLEILHRCRYAPPDRFAFWLTAVCEYICHIQGHLMRLVAVLADPGVGGAVDVYVTNKQSRPPSCQ